jgi:hypothetical protein
LHRYEAGKGTGDPERDMNANDRQEKRCRWDWDARDDRYVTGHSQPDCLGFRHSGVATKIGEQKI